MTAPIDLEVAIRGWTLAAELRAIAEGATVALDGDLSPAAVAAILGTLLGQLDGIAHGLESVEVVL